MKRGKVIWITGLSGSGKSTLAKCLAPELKQRGENVISLDGDELRNILPKVNSHSDEYSRNNRLQLAMTYSKLCELLANQGFTVIISTISMFHEIYLWNRKNLPNYFQVYLEVPLHELEKRDPKDIYKNFRHGIAKNVIGLDQPFDKPIDADWKPVYDPNKSNDFLVKDLLTILLERDYL